MDNCGSVCRREIGIWYVLRITQGQFRISLSPLHTIKTGDGMKFYLISDNVDTQIGMHLAGIDGVVVHEENEVRDALSRAMDMPDVAVILMTERLVQLCPELVYDLKLNRKQPLIVEIPDRHGSGRAKDSITRYVREAIGVKI